VQAVAVETAAEPVASEAAALRPARALSLGGMTGPAGVLALQRSIGNRAVARLAQDRQGGRGAGPRVLARYAHADCTEADLKNHIWPADYIARQMVKKARKALSKSPIEAPVAALFPKYFMTSTPDIPKILRIFDKVEVEFADNDYTYECEEDCAGSQLGETYAGTIGALTQAHIHICMNHLRGKPNECVARTIVHEFTHRYADTDDNGYCKSGCGYSTCPTTLTPDKALENADSFACFAFELWPIALLSYP
jgi:hypothetical protein